ncbi:NifB/NifX family molybdenum-iron cluster-binding protein [Heliophilum fasciatum]|uniref:Dinitrogenase iron-molybdenum cofactor n=1 Tax=Heliophilum fasciatum TaxID=35700 RepID=A0A4R2RP88_9FIRM|nr:NifB/NifX family molybdenum-iron cluster-binding protein [Heliophilum fasciatum]MCW2277676.1 putative Fe-Mo cluster-binding NifX family protein [Heliophilum fasciatum]TCP65023.1 dinitrogenase iron-molybdenum cofactor [Heliophilum fasciatum]
MSYKVAVTSSDGLTIDQHFGHAKSFHILEVDEASGAWENIGLRVLPEEPLSHACGSGCRSEVQGGQQGGSQNGHSGGCLGGHQSGSPSGCQAEKTHGHGDPHLYAVASLLGDCIYLLTQKIGQRPYGFLQQQGINALESPRHLPTVINKLHQYHLKNRMPS